VGMGFNRTHGTALAESVTCGASRVISGAGEACEALSRCVGGAPCVRFCPFHFTRTPTTRYIFYLTRLGPSLCAFGYVAGLLRVQGCSQLVPQPVPQPSTRHQL
jgi:hypothetical protein